jgi:DNA modification methylase
VAGRAPTSSNLDRDSSSTRGAYEIHQVDAFAWLADAERQSIHAVVTDPPYGLVEYTPKQLEKMKDGRVFSPDWRRS